MGNNHRCVPLALLYDIHGNLPALEAVVADARARGADEWFLGGDYTAFGAWPAETLDALAGLEGAVWIRGNWERWLGGDRDDMPDLRLVAGAQRFCLERLDAATVQRLGGLPGEVREHGALLCHGAPGSDMQSFLPAEQESDARLLRDVHATRVVFGHTHIQFHRATHDGVELVNPGSVGLPFDDDPRAAYALLPTELGEIELHRVAYDHASVAAALRAIGEDWAGEVAQMVERAGR
jgi:predicted phosphodiesterase